MSVEEQLKEIEEKFLSYDLDTQIAFLNGQRYSVLKIYSLYSILDDALATIDAMEERLKKEAAKKDDGLQNKEDSGSDRSGDSEETS